MIQEAYVHSVSTRSVDDLVKALGMSGVSKSLVSRLCEEIDERVGAVLSRPLESDWPCLWIDATYVKARQNSRVVSAFVAIAFAQNDAQAAKQQWRRIADQLRPKLPKLAILMDDAEADVLVYMDFPPSAGRSCARQTRSSA